MYIKVQRFTMYNIIRIMICSPPILSCEEKICSPTFLYHFPSVISVLNHIRLIIIILIIQHVLYTVDNYQHSYRHCVNSQVKTLLNWQISIILNGYTAILKIMFLIIDRFFCFNMNSNYMYVYIHVCKWSEKLKSTTVTLNTRCSW